MKNKDRSSARRIGAWTLRTFCVLAVAGLLTLAARTGNAQADHYDPQQAGNPIRIAAYILHPLGVLLDYGLMRPCFWVVQREPFSTIFGYERPWNKDHPEQD